MKSPPALPGTGSTPKPGVVAHVLKLRYSRLWEINGAKTQGIIITRRVSEGFPETLRKTQKQSLAHAAGWDSRKRATSKTRMRRTPGQEDQCHEPQRGSTRDGKTIINDVSNSDASASSRQTHRVDAVEPRCGSVR
jgi:hypothetical protein